MKRVFGIVPSRRLGRSLGVSPIPLSTCTYSCVYCQLGRTRHMQDRREVFFKLEELMEELKAYEEKRDQFDVITLVGEGEPTLYARFGELIEAIKIRFNKKVVLITNGSLLFRPEVQTEALKADIVMPSLDAWDEDSFKQINRPFGRITFEEMFDGLRLFRERYRGEFYLENMCISGITDREGSAEKLIDKIRLLKPDSVFINTPVRPPAEDWVKRCPEDFLKNLQGSFGTTADVEIPDSSIFSNETDFYSSVLDIIQRHPLDLKAIRRYCSDRCEDFEIIMKKMNEDDKIERIEYENNLFYRIKTIRK
ncbi:MAG TPA: radical SAM protein [Thermotogota bacterium]|nr:radical SAM protein [Thermotogota bacterium]HPJ89557.1 radical SAM protein [Thermotogota bacterium]